MFHSKENKILMNTFPRLLIDVGIMMAFFVISCLVIFLTVYIVKNFRVTQKSTTKKQRSLSQKRFFVISRRICFRFKCRLKYELEFWLNTINAYHSCEQNIRINPILKYILCSRVLKRFLVSLDKMIYIPKCQDFITITDSNKQK